MIVAIASSENDINSLISEHFGRCPWFCIYDTVRKKTSFIQNPFSGIIESAGCQTVDMLVRKSVKIMIAGRFGAKVVEQINQENIQMIVPEKLISIQEMLKKLNNK